MATVTSRQRIVASNALDFAAAKNMLNVLGYGVGVGAFATRQDTQSTREIVITYPSWQLAV